MIDQKYTLSFAKSEDTQVFTSAPEAGAAFYRAKAEDGPRVIKSMGRAASTLARTTTCGDTLAKQLPLGSDTEFTKGFQAEQTLSN